MGERHRLLVVEDDPATAQDLVEMIAALGWEAVAVDNKQDAEASLQREQFCLVLLDLQIKNEHDSILPVEAAGLALLSSIKTNSPSVPIVVVSGHVSEWEAGVGVMRDGATDVMRKPISDHRHVMDKLRSAFERTSRSSHDACSGGRTGAITISIPGTRRKQRTEVRVDDRSAPLTDKPLRTLLHLIRAKLANERVHRTELGERDEGTRAISDLRKALQSALAGVDIIENDGASNYWLVETVQIGTCNEEALREIGNQRITKLAEQIRCLIAVRAT
ncbi:MAG TPA: response regulator [Kofleriaceae bacterium]|jgi:DNA-binding response OmpR family regulator